MLEHEVRLRVRLAGLLTERKESQRVDPGAEKHSIPNSDSPNRKAESGKTRWTPRRLESRNPKGRRECSPAVFERNKTREEKQSARVCFFRSPDAC